MSKAEERRQQIINAALQAAAGTAHLRLTRAQRDVDDQTKVLADYQRTLQIAQDDWDALKDYHKEP